MHIGKVFLLIGVVFIVLGAVWTFIGKLPGDFMFKKGNTTVYIPVMTSIVVSIVLTLIFYVIGKFR